MTATKQTMTNADVYERVTAQIISELEKGVVPWKDRWQGASSGMPVNALTRRPYNGVNVLALWATSMARGYASDGWLTFNAARKHGMMVRKGEKATPVIYMKRIVKKDKTTGEEESIFLARLFYVFNLDQVEDQKGREGTRAKLAEKLVGKVPTGAESLRQFDQMVKRTKARINHKGTQAFYSPTQDAVTMPPKASFVSTPLYYATLSHELAHWTGHPTRLGRYEITGGSWTRTNGLDRPQEELIAELSAAFTCARLGVEHISQAASYLQSWLEHLNNDKRFLVKAASEASKASNFLLGVDEGSDDDEEGDDA